MFAVMEQRGANASEGAAAPKQSAGKTSMAIVNFLLDAALFVNMIFIMWVSAALQFLFPAPAASAGWSLWGLSYHQWRNVQFGALCLFALLAVEHLVLHWTWVCSIIASRVLKSRSRPDEAEQAVYGVGTFIVTLIFVMGTLIAAMLSVTPPP